MEILSEILLSFLQLLLEFLLQLVLELVANTLGLALKSPFERHKPVDPLFAAFGYFLYGLITGGISLWLFPSGIIKVYWLRVASVALIPMASGLAMGFVGSTRRRHGKRVIRLTSFVYGGIFALAMSILRFHFSQ